MLTVSFYFLGLSVFILASSICFSLGKHANKRVMVDLDALHAASVCLPTGRRMSTDGIKTAIFKDMSWDEKAKLSTMRVVWTQWYEQCKRKAILKQKAIYSWARTLALSAVLCLMGVMLEAEFDQPITLSNILAGFKRPRPTAASCHAPQTIPARSESVSHTN